MKGFIIAKPGNDATKVREVDDYVTTKAPILKVLTRDKGKIVFALSDAGTSKDIVIKHGLGYKPLVQVFADRQPLGRMRLVSSTTQIITQDLLAAICFVTDSTLTIRFISLDALSDPTGRYRYFYYIFADDAEDT